MLKYKKVAFIGTGVATVISSVLLLAAPVSAAPKLQKVSLSGQLAQTFHLNKKAVQKSIQQYYKTHPGANRLTYKQRLTLAVSKGKITTTQEQAILVEHQQLIKSLKGLKSETPTQRKATIKAERASARAWAKSNNIPVGLLFMRHY